MPLSRPFADTVRERVARDPAFAQALLDERDAEAAESRAEIARLAAACLSKEAAIEDLRAMLAEMQDDLDAAHRLLGLAPYPLTA